MQENLTDEEFAELFGFYLLRPTGQELEKAAQINALFDALETETGVHSLEVYSRAGQKALHRHFLSRVSDCPESVLNLAQIMLAPDSPERTRRKKSRP